MYWVIVSDKAIGIETKIEVDIGSWGTQWFESLIASDKKLELDK